MSSEPIVDVSAGLSTYSPETAPARSWRTELASRIPPSVADEIDLFENQLELRKQGKLEDKVFAELRLRRGAYGQRYDNGKR